MRVIGFIAWIGVLIVLAGCGGDRFTPRVAPGEVRFETVTPRRVTILLMTPAYGFVEQVRHGNMGHAAIEIDGRLYDMGALNGYAFVFKPTPAVRFWDLATADAALAALANQPDASGHLDRIVRFDITVTGEQARRLREWWEQMERHMLADTHNRIYLWSQWQCASSVSHSLRDAGVIRSAPQNPKSLAGYLEKHFRSGMTLVQAGRKSRHEPGWFADAGTLIFRWPWMLGAGHRTSGVMVETPDGKRAAMVWSDSKDYLKRVATFAIQPADAVRIATGGKQRVGVQSVPNFIAGRWYHIAADHVIGQAALGGLYVNGDTGSVTTIDDPRVVRFDAFDGDRVVTPPIK